MIRQFLWLVLIVAAAAGFYSWQVLDQEQSGTPGNQDNQPDYVAVDLTRMIYDEEGHLSDLIRAQRMEHFERFGFLQFDFPIYTIYQEKVPLWQVTSEQAVLYPDDKLILEHRVELRNMSTDPLFTRIETNAVELLFNSNTLQSNEQVRIFGLGFQITGKGMLADLNEQNVELKQHTKTVYYNEK